MPFARLGGGVDETQRCQRLGWRVAVLQILEDRAAVGVATLCRKIGEEPPIAFDHESCKATLDVRFGFPRQFVADGLKLLGRGGGVGSVTAVFLEY